MMRTRTTSSILALVLLAGLLALAGCGGGSSGTSTTAEQVSTSAGDTSSDTAQRSSAPARPERRRQHEPAAEPVGQEGRAEKASKPVASTDPDPLPNQGSDAVAPGVPTVKGGDNSIQAYGVEAESAQRIAATRLVGSYLAAQAAGEWEAACAQLSVVAQEQLAIAAQKSPRVKDKGCAGGMAVVVETVPRAQRESAARIHVLSYRVKGPQAFLIYRDGAGGAFNMPLRREGGEWRIASLAGLELVL
jgi:hypothetical protein